MKSSTCILVNGISGSVNWSNIGGIFMIQITQFQHKKVLVLGLAKSGVAASLLTT